MSGRGPLCRALFVDQRPPMPDRDAGSLRAVRLMELVAGSGVDVVFAADEPMAGTPGSLPDGVQPLTTGAASLLSSRELEPDLVVLSRLPVAERHLGTVRRRWPASAVVFDTVDLHFLREERAARREGGLLARLGAVRTRRKELAVASAVDATLLVGAHEAELLARLRPGLLLGVVGLIHNPRPPSARLESRRDILFVGGFAHRPNVGAVTWFAREVLPLVRRRRPELRLEVVGSDPPPEVAALAGPGVVVRGFVPDLEPLYAERRLSIAPLLVGAGVKGKVSQSLARGLPCVTTTIGAEGMGIEDGIHALVRDDPAGMAAAIAALDADDALWRRLSAAGLALAEERFSPPAARRGWLELLGRLGFAV